MSIGTGKPPSTLPESVRRTLAEFSEAFGAKVRLGTAAADAPGMELILYESPAFDAEDPGLAREALRARGGGPLTLEVSTSGPAPAAAVARTLASVLERDLEMAREVEFFTHELSERYEEINLLYSISEILGSILRLDDAARVILEEVRDVMGARRASLWIHDPGTGRLHLTAAVGEGGVEGPLTPEDAEAVTARVFREGRSEITGPSHPESGDPVGPHPEASFLSVPIRYTPPSGEPRTVGVINLIGRRESQPFSKADQRLLSAIASQVGAALENNRLIQESLSKERMAREMELAHDLQMKLLPDAACFEGAEAAARVSPAEQVGGDFFQLFRLPHGRVGVMLGDVSLHGFPSALIMTLTLSAAGIYAREHDSPARVLREMDNALSDELATTEMFLTVFYGVIDPEAGTLCYSNAGHPHAFIVHPSGAPERLEATDPPMGFAGPDAYGEREVPWATREDLLLLFTDGLSDILSTGTRNDGESRVLAAVAENRTRPAQEIVDALFALTNGAEPPIQGDDRTGLVVRV
ncbi:MAG: PP2C family protein-serine/threonine phosphatase [Gemmatimonadota bacterium]